MFGLRRCPKVFNQLAWSLGMFSQTACVLFAVGYCCRNTTLAKAWSLTSGAAQPSGLAYKIVWPATVLAGVYVLELGFLHWAFGAHDSTALDWAVVVLLLGALVVNPLAAAAATVPAILARGSFVFAYSADLSTKTNFESHGRWLLDTRFWIDELWIWFDPGVILLLSVVVIGMSVQAVWRKLLRCEYPIWIGVPIAITAQGAYLLAADSQWDNSSAMQYLQDEAAPATISLALVTTALVVLLRTLNAERDRRRMQQAELESARNKLKFLNAQINPHFFNNSLNTIAAVSATQPERTQELINKLALHFRAQCDETRALVSFEDEWKLVQCYIDIEQVRMGERLNVQLQLDPACMNVSVPRLVVQPLVENAIQHGIQSLSEAGLLRITALVSNSRLCVTIEDNGIGRMQAVDVSEFGTGLRNVQSRLNHLYGLEASLTIESEWGTGTCATLDIPSKALESA